MPDILALNVRRLRLAKGVTQEELVHRAGMDRSYPGTIERAEHKAIIVPPSHGLPGILRSGTAALRMGYHGTAMSLDAL